MWKSDKVSAISTIIAISKLLRTQDMNLVCESSIEIGVFKQLPKRLKERKKLREFFGQMTKNYSGRH